MICSLFTNCKCINIWGFDENIESPTYMEKLLSSMNTLNKSCNLEIINIRLNSRNQFDNSLSGNSKSFNLSWISMYKINGWNVQLKQMDTAFVEISKM